MKKIASLMLLLLSPICARAMDANSFAAASDAPLSPRTRCLRDGSNRPLLDMIKREIAALPNPDNAAKDASSLMKTTQKAIALKELSLTLRPMAKGADADESMWRKAQACLSDETKAFYMKEIIANLKESVIGK